MEYESRKYLRLLYIAHRSINRRYIETVIRCKMMPNFQFHSDTFAMVYVCSLFIEYKDITLML